MNPTPSIDLSCARCGAPRIYQLVPAAARPTEEDVRAIPHTTPSIDLSCSRYGASQTYKLVPDSVRQASSSRRDRSRVQLQDTTALEDPTQGREAGEQPYEDPTQGREIGHLPYADPTRAR